MGLGSLRWLSEGTKGGQIHSVHSVSHPVRDRPANRHCKFLHLTDANFLYSPYIYKPNWYIRLANPRPSTKPNSREQNTRSNFQGFRDKTFSVGFFFFLRLIKVGPLGLNHIKDSTRRGGVVSRNSGSKPSAAFFFSEHVLA